MGRSPGVGNRESGCFVLTVGLVPASGRVAAKAMASSGAPEVEANWFRYDDGHGQDQQQRFREASKSSGLRGRGPTDYRHAGRRDNQIMEGNM